MTNLNRVAFSHNNLHFKPRSCAQFAPGSFEWCFKFLYILIGDFDLWQAFSIKILYKTDIKMNQNKYQNIYYGLPDNKITE